MVDNDLLNHYLAVNLKHYASSSFFTQINSLRLTEFTLERNNNPFICNNYLVAFPTIVHM